MGSHPSPVGGIQDSALRPVAVPALALVFLASVYWGTFSRNLVGGTHDDPANLMWRATQFEVAHTNGYPAYLCLLRLLYECVPADRFILCANALSAVCALMALSLGFVLLRCLSVTRAAAVTWMLFIGLSETFWSQALFCEVYQFSHVLLLAALLALLGCLRRLQPMRFLAVGFLCGLQLAHHLLAAPLSLLVAGTAMILAFRNSPRPGRSACSLIVGLLVGLLPYLYIPLSWWFHGIPWSEGFHLPAKFGLGGSSLLPSYFPLSAAWEQASTLLFRDLGLLGIALVTSGTVLALIAPAHAQTRLLGVILASGGVAAPVLFLMRLRPWESDEVLAFYLLPIFCLSLFIPFALDVLWARIQALPGRKPRTLAVWGLSGVAVIVLHANLSGNYPRLKQCFGDLRYAAVKEALKDLRPGDTVVSYSCYGSYQFWKLIALPTGLHKKIQWGSFSEDSHRASPSQREKLREFLAVCDSQKGRFYVLTDSPDVVLPALQDRKLRVEMVFQITSHEQPGFSFRAGGQTSLHPRNWLELLSGQTVWELGTGFPSGHLAHSLAMSWFCIPGGSPKGSLIFSNEFGSRRYARQRVYAVGGSFTGKGSGERIDLDLDPMSHGRVPQSWLRKEKVAIPFGLKVDPSNPPPGDFLFTQISCAAPFDTAFESRPVVQTLFRVSK